MPNEITTGQVAATSDYQIIEIFLRDLSPHTQRAYAHDISEFYQKVNKTLPSMVYEDLQDYRLWLENKVDSPLSPESIHRKLAAIKSLFKFCFQLGYLKYDIARLIKLPKTKLKLASRILTEWQVKEIIRKQQEVLNNPHNKRNKNIVYRNICLFNFIYYTGVRVSEVTNLKWTDIHPSPHGYTVTVYGKGGKTRVLLLPHWIYDDLKKLPSQVNYVFVSRRGGKLDEDSVRVAVKQAGKLIGVDCTPHFFRHSHASHSINHGAPLHLVQKGLGHSSLATTSMYLHANPDDSPGLYLK